MANLDQVLEVLEEIRDEIKQLNNEPESTLIDMSTTRRVKRNGTINPCSISSCSNEATTMCPECSLSLCESHADSCYCQ